MNSHTLILRVAPVALLSAVFLIGCRKQETVSTYSAPKDPANTTATGLPPAEAPAAAPVRLPPEAASAGNQTATWTVPQGWQTMPPGQIAVAKFAATPDSQVVCSVTKFGGDGGGVLANVNRWQKELALPVSTEAELAKVVKQTTVGGSTAQVVNLVGPVGATGGQRTVLAAIVGHDDLTWFIKMAGPADKVATQQANFDAFLHSWQFVSAPTPVAQEAGPTAPAADPTFPTPPGWAKEPVTNAMGVVSYKYKIGSGDDQAEVVVSKMPADNVGSFEDNLTRWRRQVGLAVAADMEGVTTRTCTVGGLPGQSFDLSGPASDGKKARRLVVCVTGDESQKMAWFFKILGPADVVKEQQATFEQFVNSVKLSGAPATK